jgi:hypothetical protein
MAQRFTVHGSWSLFAGVFVALTVVETPLVHWALASYPIVAWTLSVLQVLTIVWLVRDARSLAQGGVYVSDDAIELRIGRRWRGTIPRAAIVGVERGDVASKRNSFAILGANVVLHLRERVTIHGPVGMQRVVDTVGLSLDEPDAFVRRVALPT